MDKFVKRVIGKEFDDADPFLLDFPFLSIHSSGNIRFNKRASELLDLTLNSRFKFVEDIDGKFYVFISFEDDAFYVVSETGGAYNTHTNNRRLLNKAFGFKDNGNVRFRIKSEPDIIEGVEYFQLTRIE